MARRKRWFFTQISETLSPAKARQMLEQMQMPPEAFEVILGRFWQGRNMNQIDSLSRDQQLKMLPLWDQWARTWADENPTFFLLSDDDLTT